MGSILAVVPRRERPLIRARARRLRATAARFPDVSHRLRHRTCVQVTAMAPELTTDRLALLLRHALWSYWLDDRLDASGIDVAGAARLRAGVTAVTTGAPADPLLADPLLADPLFADPLLAELAWIVRELDRYARGGGAARWYGRALRDTVDAEVDEIRVRHESGGQPASGADQTIEQYLSGAVETINYRSFAYALLAAGGDRLTEQQLRYIDAALTPACRALRLANDVRSLARDERAGARNALRLRTADGAPVTAAAAWAEVRRQAAAHDTELLALAGRGLVPAAASRALNRSLAQALRLYRRTDLR